VRGCVLMCRGLQGGCW